MKKVILAVLLLGITGAARAQFEIGVKGGINRSAFNTAGFMGDSTGLRSKASPELGTQYGISLGYEKNRFLTLQAEVLYSEFNSTHKGSINAVIVNVGINQKLKTTFLQVPVQAKFTFPVGKFRPYVGVGAAYSRMTKGVVETNITIPNFTNVNDRVNLADTNWTDVNRTDISANLSAGLYYKLGPGNLSFDVRRQWGLLDLNKTKGSVYTRSTLFSVGYVFILGLKKG